MTARGGPSARSPLEPERHRDPPHLRAARRSVAFVVRGVAAAAACALVTGVAVLRCGGAPASRPPDVLLLVMDTTRADRCSVTGYGRPTTPRLEELAKESVVFDDAWSPSSWTLPSHAAAFTGRSPASLGLLSPERDAIPPDARTLASILGAAGWSTACFTCNAWIAPHSGLTRGFATGDVHALYPESPRANAQVAHERALDWMRAQRKADRRFFTFINDMEPHCPYTPPEDLAAKFVDPTIPAVAVQEARSLRPPRTTRVSLGVEALDPDVLRAVHGLYDAEIARLDAEIGKLLDTMRAEGLLDNTFVVIAGDHGEGLMQHGWLEHSVMVHREMLRVPIVVRPVGGTAPRRVATPVELGDVFPTILEACGLEIPAGTETRSLLTDAAPRTPRATEVGRVSFLGGFRMIAPGFDLSRAERRRRSIYDGRHHLIVDDRGGAELYDVAADPDERNDLARKLPDVVRALTAKLDAPPK